MAGQRSRLRQRQSQRTSTEKSVRIGFLGAIVAAIISASASCSGAPVTVNVTANPATDTVIRAVISSEKQDFFNDPQVKQVLYAHGFTVDADYMGSQEMASRAADKKDHLSQYEIAFPSSEPTADAIRSSIPSATATPIFESPIVIATFLPIAQLLQNNQLRIAEHHPDGNWTFNVQNFLKVSTTGLLWDEIPGNTTYPSPNQLLLTTTDPAQSNSADMLVAIVSHVLKGGLVTDRADVTKYSQKIASLFIDQGYTGYSSQDPMDQYLSSDGMDLAPMVLIYEAQFIGTKINEPGRMNHNMILMYPDPTVESWHTVVILNPKAPKASELQRFTSLLQSDSQLTRLEAEHGFRSGEFSQVMSKYRITPPPPDGRPDLNLVRLPSYEILKGFLDAIKSKYHAQV